jgi:excisionase family DNA binding protein
MLTISELAARLRLTTKTVRNHIRQGLLPPPIKIGARYRWPQAQIDDWLAAGCPRVKA